MSSVKAVTREDVIEVVEEIVGRVVGEIVSEALQLISERFDRLENKLDTAIARIDHHDIDIRELQRKTA